MPREKEDIGEYYETIIQHKPGITGYWQVNGRNDVTFEDRIDMDVKYHNNNSLKLDAKLLLKTVSAVTKKKGAN